MRLRQDLPTRLLAVFLLAGAFACGGPEAPGPGPDVPQVLVPDLDEPTEEAAARLARALAAATSLEQARPVVLEVLARSGVQVRTRSCQPVARAVEPAAGLWLTPQAADNLALDHLEGAGLPMDQLAVAQAECPVEGAELWAEPEVLRAFIENLWLAGFRNPNAPTSFGPLFLKQVAWTRGENLVEVEPSEYSLSYLEILVFGLSVRRGVGELDADREAQSALHAPLSLVPEAACPTQVGQGLGSSSFALGANPCSWLEEAFSKDWKDAGTGLAGAGIDEVLERAAEEATRLSAEGAEKAAKTAAAAVGYVTALVSWVASVGRYSLTVEPSPGVAHYLGFDGSHGNVKTQFLARVSSRSVFDKEVQSCLDWLGIELPDEDSAAKSIVRWVPRYGTSGKPKHATVLLDQQGGRLEQKVGSDGVATLDLQMAVEKSTEVARNGLLKKDRIVMQVELFTENPSGGKIAGWLFGGVPEALKCWADKWFPKRTLATMPVEYHVKGHWGFFSPATVAGWRVVQSGEGREGLYAPWTVTTTGTLLSGTENGTITGKLDFVLVEGGRAAVSGTTTMRIDSVLSSDFWTQSTGEVTGEAWIEGTREAPTLVIHTRTVSTITTKAGPYGDTSTKETEATDRGALVVYEEGEE